MDEVSAGEAGSMAADLAAAIAEMAGAMLALPDLEQLLTRIAQLAAAAVGGDTWCGLTLRSDGRPFTVAHSDPRTVRVDELQYARGDGPCLQTLRTGQVISVPDLAAESRWGDYPAHAVGEGARSSLSLPLVIDGGPTGALNLYAAEPDAFDSDRVQAATVIAAGAAGAVAMAMRLAAQVSLTEQMRTALSTRAVIDQAIGIIIGERRCSPDEAFSYLRRSSQQRNVRLHQVATELVQDTARNPRPRSR